MKTTPTNSVCVDSDVIDYVIPKMLGDYPIECGFFLCGTKAPRRKNVYCVDNWYSPASNADTQSWAWENTQWANATRWAVREQAGKLIGMAHSHPGKFPYFNYTHPSISDVELQKEFHFDISLIVNIWQDSRKELNWYMTAWHSSGPLSLETCIRKGNVIHSIYSLTKKKSSQSFWEGYKTFSI